MKPWRKIVFWFGVAGFLACMAWTILSGDITRGLINTNVLYITNSYSPAWLKVHLLKTDLETHPYEWSNTNVEIICTHEPIVSGPTNGEWTIRFK